LTFATICRNQQHVADSSFPSNKKKVGAQRVPPRRPPATKGVEDSAPSHLPSSPSAAAASRLPKYTLGAMLSFYLCIFQFPIRKGCDQDWFMVLSHLTSLLFAFVFSFGALASPRAPKDVLFAKLFAAVLAVSFGTACLGTAVLFFRVFFVVCEILIMAVYCAWATHKVKVMDSLGEKAR
jgi:hypothetical protein